MLGFFLFFLELIVVCQCHRSWRGIIKVIAGCRVMTVQKTVEVPQFLFQLAKADKMVDVAVQYVTHIIHRIHTACMVLVVF